jgi:hypothetical protein
MTTYERARIIANAMAAKANRPISNRQTYAILRALQSKQRVDVGKGAALDVGPCGRRTPV